MINIIIADDHKLFRESLKLMISQDEDINVVALAGNGEEAYDLCLKYKPDLIIMDISMPILDGIECSNRLKKEIQDIKIIVLTSFEEKDKILQAMGSRVDGYVIKDIDPEQLILSIKAVNKGLYVLHPVVYNVMNGIFKENYEFMTKEDNKLVLEEIEIVILKMIVDGFSNKEISLRLNYSEGTIKNKVSVILDKLGTKDRIQAAVFALKNHII